MQRRLLALVVATPMAWTSSAHAVVIVLTGHLDASQVVAPVYQLDPAGNQVLDQSGSPIVIGSTNVTASGAPVSTSTATGFATVTVDTVADTIVTDFAWTGLTGVADRSHLHDAPAGVSRFEPPNDRFFHEVIGEQYAADGTDTGLATVAGGFVDCGTDPTTPSPYCAPASGSLHDILYTVSDRFAVGDPYAFADWAEFTVALETNGMFLDIHTQAYPGGEIRGQLLYAPIPEPASLALVAGATLAAGALGRSRRRMPLEARR